MDKLTAIGWLMIGIPVGGELQQFLISQIYHVIGFGWPADFAGSVLAALGTVSLIAGLGIIAIKLKPAPV